MPTNTKVFLMRMISVGQWAPRVEEYDQLIRLLKTFLGRAPQVCGKTVDIIVVSNVEAVLEAMKEIPTVNATSIFLSRRLIEEAKSLCQPFGVREAGLTRKVVLLTGSSGAGKKIEDDVIVMGNASFHQTEFLNTVL